MRAEDLEILNQANRLLNRKQIKLGMKPRMVTSVMPELRQKKLQQVIDDNQKARAMQMAVAVTEKKNELLVDETPIPSVAEPVSTEVPVEISTAIETANKVGRFMPFLVFLFIVLAIVATVYMRNLSGTNSSANGDLPVYLAEELDKPVYISAGTFKSRGEANIASKKIERITGEMTRVVKAGRFYTIQIGAGYEEHEDAYLVFEELIKYPIADLSVRTVSH